MCGMAMSASSSTTMTTLITSISNHPFKNPGFATAVRLSFNMFKEKQVCYIIVCMVIILLYASLFSSGNY